MHKRHFTVNGWSYVAFREGDGGAYTVKRVSTGAIVGEVSRIKNGKVWGHSRRRDPHTYFGTMESAVWHLVHTWSWDTKADIF